MKFYKRNFIFLIKWIDSRGDEQYWRVTQLARSLISISKMDGYVLDIRVLPKIYV